MSFSSSFGVQVAAIMDVLAKAAVAEITKLVEDGVVSLRLEMCRKDSELQDLKRSLKSMEVEMCKAQEAAAASRAAEDRQPEQITGSQVQSKDEIEGEERPALYLEPNTADSLCEPQHGSEESGDDMKLVVKCEPADEIATQEATEDIATAANNVCFEAAEPEESLWPPPACSMFEQSSAEVAVQAMQQQIQIFSSHPEQLSYDSTAVEEMADDSLSVPIKVEVEMRPMCMESTPSEPVHMEQFRHVSQPAVSQHQRLQCASPQAGPSRPPSRAQRSTGGMFGSNAEDHILSRNNLRSKRLVNVFRANPKLFMCVICNKGFPRLTLLEEHNATHESMKPFRCLECGKCFTQKTRLKTHQRVHTGERPFSCKICGKRFSRQDNCLRHERFHSGVKPFSCGQCPKSFTVFGNLKIHLETHRHRR
ncbi:oocyte zinc finger protein XlCOF8.4-like [Scomber scombrus]|uniref:oocyte zinc finger protein XlCOF8.4-like n=1 Tax=Scomber scombrus TaxID=13677 RepID=UPI002DDA63D5|nr:oocyte zinc finger protein XlCOF8.4-like [Scomber scombrus]